MDWFGVSIACRAWFADVAALTLESCGARGAEIIDKDLESLRIGTIEEWPLAASQGTAPAGVAAEPAVFRQALDSMREVTVRGYFSAKVHDEKTVVQEVREHLFVAHSGALEIGLDPGSLSLAVSWHDQSEWEAAWKQGFGPVYTSGKIVVAPPWNRPAFDPAHVLVLIDPGMAFGIGTHPTTRMCLEMLERRVRPGHFVADVGTGSGILAIAAAKLGASVVAWDADPLAVEAARSNLRLNGPGLQVEIFLHTSGQPGPAGDEAVRPAMGRCDVVVANIAADILVALQKLVCTLLKPSGEAVLSGIILSKEERVTQVYSDAGFVLSVRQQDGEWVALSLRKGGP